MTASGDRRVPSVLKTMATIAAAAAAFGVAWACVVSTDRTSTDRGVVSAFAIASLAPHQAVLGDLTVAGISPDQEAKGRIALWVAIGNSGDAVQTPTETLASRIGAGDGSATASDRQGVTFVIGGAAAKDFEACEPDIEASIWPSLEYADLSPVERTAVVESLTAQALDRQPQYGRESQQGIAEAIDLAASMSYTVIEPLTLEPWAWSMEGTLRPADTTVADDQTDAQADIGETKAAGHGAYLRCDVSLETLWSTQSWGSRFELPALAVAGPASEDFTHTVARFGLVRQNELTTFSYTSQEGMETPRVEENWAGLTAERAYKFAFSKTRPVATMADITVSFASMQAASSRDVALFFAGVMLSLFASLLVAAVRQSGARRRAHR